MILIWVYKYDITDIDYSKSCLRLMLLVCYEAEDKNFNVELV